MIVTGWSVVKPACSSQFPFKCSRVFAIVGVSLFGFEFVADVDLANSIMTLRRFSQAGKGTTATTGKQEAIIPNNNWGL